MSDSGLVVPIRLEALLIGLNDQADNDFATPSADFSRLKSTVPYLGQTAANKPFASNGALPAGVHLHWNLPRALRAGAVDQDGNVTTPPAPNRWLVTRISQSGPSEVAYTSWVVESDYLAGSYSSAMAPPTVPVTPANSKATAYQYMGRVYTLSQWLSGGNQGQYFSGLTAMGYGVPDFASYYLNCVNVFAMYDSAPTAQAMPGGAVSYVVTGWYQNPTADPAASGQLASSSNTFGWNFAGSGSPSYSLYYGAVCGIHYNTAPTYKYLPDYNTSISPDIAIGNSPAEALSALISAKTGSPPQLQTILNALQLGLLKALGTPDGLARIDEGIFNHSFEMVDSGGRWDVIPTEKASIDALHTDVSPEVSGQLAAALNQLNALQLELDAATAEAASLQPQIFADWTKFMVIEYDAANAANYPPLSSVYTYLNNEIAAYNALTGTTGTIATLRVQIDALSGQIRAALPATLELTEIGAPHFHAPSNPVLLLAGNGIVPPPPDNAAVIQCVLTPDLIAAMNLPAGLVPGSVAAQIEPSMLPAVPSAASLPYPEIGGLVQITLLLDPAFSAVATGALAAQQGEGNPAVMDSMATTNAINAAQTSFVASQPISNGITLTGVLPQVNIAMHTWTEEPWNPLALSWSLFFNPVIESNTNYPSDFVTANFEFAEGNLNYVPKSQQLSNQLHMYQGSVLLSGSAGTSLGSQIEQYLSHYPDPDLQQALNKLRQQPFLAQSLGGFNNSLYMLEPSLQLPPLDPYTANPAYANLANSVARAAGDQNSHAPLVNYYYNPIRAGQIQLNALILIDEFGRYRTVNLQNMVVANTIPTAPGSPPVMSPPLRIAQHSVLLFHWLSAAGATVRTNSLPSTSPICGWVVPNHLDNSLMFYDGGGGALGSLAPASSGDAVVWQAAPGTVAPSTPMSQVMATANPVLAAFAASVVAQGSAYLAALISTFDRAQSSMAPASYARNLSTSVLLGMPLALVQAELDMQLLGLPRPNQSFSALSADMANSNVTQRTVAGFPEILFPVCLGNPGLVNDGLTGYFLQTQSGANGAWATDFSTFYTYRGDGSNPAIVEPGIATIQLSPKNGSVPALVTMLVDPRGAVHAYNGISPVRELAVPPDLAAYGLSRMVFTFLASPLVSLPSSLPIPLPAEANGTWTWVTYAGGKWVETAPAQYNTEATLQNAGRLLEGWLKLTPTPRTTNGIPNQ